MTFNWFRRQFNDSQEPTADPPADDQTAAEPAAPEPAAEAAPPAVDYLNYAKAAYENIRRRQQEEAAARVAVETAEPAREGEASQQEAIAAPGAAEPAGATSREEPQAEPVMAETSPALAEEPVLPSAATEAGTTGIIPELALAPSEPILALEPATIVEAEAAPTVEPVQEVALEELPGAPVEAALSTPDSIGGEPEEVALEPVIESDPAAPLPFWARAEAERLERLERLKERAIEEPDSLPPVPAEAAPAPEIDLPDLRFDEGFLWSAEVLAAQGRRASQISLEEITWLKRLRQGLDKTRRSLVNQLKAIVGQGPLNQDGVDEIESLLLQADVGVAATDRIITALQKKLRDEVLPPEAAIAYLKQILRDMLDQPLGERANNRIPVLVPEKDCLNIWLITGVNGAGKTTTIGKLAHIAQKSGYNCLIAAADTFRAAAVEQVKVWGQRSGVEIIANPGQNTDPAAVVFDAIAAAQARGTELLLVDTAGRLQNKKNLMDELSKIRRIIDKKATGVKIESLLVLDATLGQNGLRQAEVFQGAAQLTGVVLTKLDGTAKGGIALAIVQQLGLPIRFIGAGEGIEDLRPFSSYEFIEALLSN
ncbi:signal recognition particle-docking protein FtsY [Leptolyngbya sp. 'hensonii']|uniref:signal recognition particle-docking protein FtsY n=1 Tax=Leptolyngbya sp. 'hensonii' TaxID=1922337 RepID=UPI00094F7B73|nr:signal recognition particle-docking protein FtsY [Leptolyngbya sp. 'hensonii']OLP17126.1 signal recognition particle-docking protein FtsY [Leptolyngbya sp. 'hensonii']